MIKVGFRPSNVPPCKFPKCHNYRKGARTYCTMICGADHYVDQGGKEED